MSESLRASDHDCSSQSAHQIAQGLGIDQRLAARAFLRSVDGWEVMAQLDVPVEEGEGEEPDQFE